MKWLKYKLETTTEAADLVADMLYGLGIEGVEVSDKLPLSEQDKEKMYVDILPETLPDDGKAFLTFYVEEGEDENRAALYNSGTEILRKKTVNPSVLHAEIEEGLRELSSFVDVGTGNLSVSETNDMEWVDKWKDFFHSFHIGEDILIAPTWEEGLTEKEGEILVRIDPGIAFGTGTHETTRLCVQALKKHIKGGEKILDVGTGSAILTIVSLKLGAASAYAIDIDEVATRTAAENLETNGIEEGVVSLETGNLLEDEDLRKRVYREEKDVIVANILAPVLVPLTPLIVPALKKGGIYITSGIAAELSESVEEAIMKAGLTLLSKDTDGDWVALTARK